MNKKERVQRNGNNAPIKRSGNTYKFYLVEPPENGNADNLAAKLINIRNVEQVLVTDGDYGFIVKTRFFENLKDDHAYNYLSKKLGGNFGKITSYYQYTK